MSKHNHYLSDIITGMESKQDKVGNKPTKPSRKVVVGILAALVVLVVSVSISQLTAPKRSVAEYCKVYKQEKARLAKLPGDTYPSLLFDHPLSDAGEFMTSLDKIEEVAPVEVEPEVHTLKALYQKLHDDPSQMTSVSFAAEPVDTNMSKWTTGHCLKGQ